MGRQDATLNRAAAVEAEAQHQCPAFPFQSGPASGLGARAAVWAAAWAGRPVREASGPIAEAGPGAA